MDFLCFCQKLANKHKARLDTVAFSTFIFLSFLNSYKAKTQKPTKQQTQKLRLISYNQAFR
ncbi:hypothetical protein DMC01_04525 [Campylobacter troglodytis]|nr:hypothetical protein DMC01_04525 [Campylobacter troglodytis]